MLQVLLGLLGSLTNVLQQLLVVRVARTQPDYSRRVDKKEAQALP